MFRWVPFYYLVNFPGSALAQLANLYEKPTENDIDSSEKNMNKFWNLFENSFPFVSNEFFDSLFAIFSLDFNSEKK